MDTSNTYIYKIGLLYSISSYYLAYIPKRNNVTAVFI